MKTPSFPLRLYIYVLTALLACATTHEIHAQSVSITIGKPLPHPIEGMSAEYDPHFLTQNLGVTPDIKPGDWENIILRRISLLRLQRLRIMVLPSWYEPDNDNGDPNSTNENGFNFSTPEFAALEKLLSFCQDNGIKATLVFWGVRPGTFMLPEKGDGWILGPSRYEEWAENLSRCIRHLVVERKYSCIEAFTPVNEPDWAWLPTSTPNARKYIDMCRVLQKRLEKDGLRNKIRLNLSDNSDGGTGTHSFLKECTQNLTKEADFFNSHTYVFGYDTPDSTIYNWERENVRLAGGKPHMIGEFGSNQTVGATRQKDINRFERGVLLGRIAINCLNAGAAGLSYWALLDQYYSRGEAQGKQYGQMQQLGLWKYVKSAYAQDTAYAGMKTDYEPRPQYYAYGLLSRFIRRGDRVFTTLTAQDAGISALALKSRKGEWTYIIANPGKNNRQCVIGNPDAGKRKPFCVYTYAKGRLPQDDGMIKAEGTANAVAQKGKKLSISHTVPANSLTVITQRQE